jgi:hypothetical protein
MKANEGIGHLWAKYSRLKKDDPNSIHDAVEIIRTEPDLALQLGMLLVILDQIALAFIRDVGTNMAQ